MKRTDVKMEYTWNIGDVLSGKEEFINRYKALEKQIDFKRFKGKLSSKEVVLECYDKLYDAYLELEVLAVYAMMKRDENGADPYANEINCLIDNLSVKFSAETSFIDPELLTLGEEKLKEFLNDERFRV